MSMILEEFLDVVDEPFTLGTAFDATEPDDGPGDKGDGEGHKEHLDKHGRPPRHGTSLQPQPTQKL